MAQKKSKKKTKKATPKKTAPKGPAKGSVHPKRKVPSGLPPFTAGVAGQLNRSPTGRLLWQPSQAQRMKLLAANARTNLLHLRAQHAQRTAPNVEFTSVTRTWKGHDYRGVIVRGTVLAWFPEGAAVALVTYKAKQGKVYKPWALSRARQWLKRKKLTRDLDKLTIGARKTLSAALQAQFKQLPPP